MTAIRFVALTKTYDNGFQAVRGIDLEIRSKEFMVLVGPSGCGKTTSLRMIGGLEDISSGDLFIGDRRVNDVEPKDRDIAMVFQSYALYPQMTVGENMGYALTLRGLPKADIARTVEAAAKTLGLEAQLKKLPGQLSGGQRQRVALGRAIVRNPKVFLFDEPLSNLDAKMRGEMRTELRALQARLATTAVYVTHDQIEAMTLGDRITVMNTGRIQQVAEPMTIYDWPWNRFVANFIGTPPMNFLAGTLAGPGAGPAIVLGDQPVTLRMDHRQGLAGSAGKAVVLGIRPEHLHLGCPEGCDPLAATVILAELMGDHQYIHADSPAGRVVVKADCSRRVRPGEAVTLGLDTRRAHVFDAGGDEARNLTLPAGFPQQQ